MIDQRAVHRTRDDEVFLVDAVVAGDRVSASGVISSGHSRMLRSGGRLPGILVLEIFRQAGFLMAHEAAGMPFGWHLVTSRVEMVWRAGPPHVASNSAFAFEVTGEVGVERRGGEPCYLQFTAELASAGRVIATGTIEAYSLAPDRYQALRRHALVAPHAHLVADTQSNDDGSPGRVVGWDDSDPFLFNRPGDHVVSMALIEAILAAAEAHSSGRPTSVEVEFLHFAERNSPVYLAPPQRRGGDDVWELHQDDRLIVRAFTRCDTPEMAPEQVSGDNPPS
ncbi:AfsA-related hotdog domain-containing protein [Microbacterium rhizomatis]|uniref:A-factor biosynthesis hotdog domain-containing protein n=1 Tax=Microbacterium rhizomatis TaxID=1631477 RepID=A0A5J5J3U1_9MICO|nr:AfsA-related hotdog domain-containing protein [Microbacterium rhizomatis]KAA9110670.1 hypothetical protein F6B43_03175 [Microbacterium rhizomatis]